MLSSKRNSTSKAILPVLTRLQKISNNAKLTKNANKLIGDDTWYNCWGFTAYTFQWLKKLDWIEEEKMEFCLEEYTEKVKTPKAGDIFVMRDDCGILLHTGILMDFKKKKIIHKPGHFELEVNNINGAQRVYGKQKISYRRALPNKKFNSKKYEKSDYFYIDYYEN